MARQGQRTTLDERIEIGERSDAGQTDPEISAAMGRSVWTVRKWRRRHQREGRPGLASRVGRPHTSALGSFSPELREVIRQMRQAHPGWGPQTIRTELEVDRPFAAQALPSRSRIAAFLKQEGLTRRYERHSDLPQPRTEVPRQAHEEWEMDAKGALMVGEAGLVSLINICDVFSTLKAESYPCVGVSKPTAFDYQLALRRAFLRHGLPQWVALDHDSVFYDNTSPSPYPTPLHLWLIALGVEVTFGRKGCPTDQAIVERAHQTLTQQALLGQALADQPAIQAALDDRRDFLNTRFPSRSLGHRPPLVAYPEALHSGRPYRPEWERELLEMQWVYAYLAQGRWFRRVSAQGQFSLGNHRYGVGKALANQMLEITFDPETQTFVCRSEDASQTIRLPAQGLSQADLMGELEPPVTLPVYQLALPFSLPTWRQMQLYNDLTGTTL